MSSQSVAVVTGASRGIGKGIALALAKEKFNIVLNYASNLAAAEETRGQVQALGAGAVLVRADVSVPGDRQAILDAALDAYGRVDLLVNNAGVAPEARADVLDATEESFDRLIRINLKGPYFLTQLVARRMIEMIQAGKVHAPEHAPKIVNITSVSAYAASTNRGDYCVAKAGLAMMTQLYAARLAEFGINVYEIRPGVIETDMTGPVKEKYDRLIEEGLTPIRRWGKPVDVARAVVAVAKDYLPFSTGEVINVDGGFHLRRL